MSESLIHGYTKCPHGISPEGECRDCFRMGSAACGSFPKGEKAGAKQLAPQPDLSNSLIDLIEAEIANNPYPDTLVQLRLAYAQGLERAKYLARCHEAQINTSENEDVEEAAWQAINTLLTKREYVVGSRRTVLADGIWAAIRPYLAQTKASVIERDNLRSLILEAIKSIPSDAEHKMSKIADKVYEALTAKN